MVENNKSVGQGGSITGAELECLLDFQRAQSALLSAMVMLEAWHFQACQAEDQEAQAADAARIWYAVEGCTKVLAAMKPIRRAVRAVSQLAKETKPAGPTVPPSTSLS